MKVKVKSEATRAASRVGGSAAVAAAASAVGDAAVVVVGGGVPSGAAADDGGGASPNARSELSVYSIVLASSATPAPIRMLMEVECRVWTPRRSCSTQRRYDGAAVCWPTLCLFQHIIEFTNLKMYICFLPNSFLHSRSGRVAGNL